MEQSAEQGLDATLDQLFAELPPADPPINYNAGGDPEVPIGATWVTAPYRQPILNDQLGYRMRSLRGWMMGRMLNEGMSIREKLTLFWHNHFTMQSVLDPKFLYRHYRLLQDHAWGNFRELVKEVTIDPAMLILLNGNRNTKHSPNENYARELLELYSIGKGPLAGPGDYTNYTEQDVREVARILTGWMDFGFTTSTEDGSLGSVFVSSRHDEGVKVLSHRFDNAEIPDRGEREVEYLINLIFQKPATARFISRKLYQWFIYYKTDDEIEANVIEPMAQILIDNDYEIKPALRALLRSEHFYASQNIGAMIKHPYDYIMSIFKPLGVEISGQVDEAYNSWYRLFSLARPMQMEYFSIPEVAGWLAYYRQPLYYRNWINANTLPPRLDLINALTGNGVFPFGGNSRPMVIDVLAIVAGLDDPLDPNALIEDLGALLFPKPLREEQVRSLKEIIIPGLPDFEWTIEYGDYLANPNNSALAASIERKLRTLLRTMLTMPEFHLS